MTVRKLLPMLCLLLVACDISTQPAPTPSPSPAPTHTVRLPAVSADPRPSTSPTPAPSITPSPAARLPLRPQTMLATYFFYWYDCPRARCDPETVPVVPPGWNKPLPEGGFISTQNPIWFEREVRHMADAGIQVVLPVSWGGEFPDKAFRTPVLFGLVEANARLGVPLRIGMFDDTSSQMAEYGDYLDDGRVNGSSYQLTQTISLARPESGFFFYDRKIKPFFQLVPRDQWALVNGRPLLVVYTAGCCFDLQHAGQLWQAVKQAFLRDFDVVPWLVLEDSWFQPQASQPPPGQPAIEEVADGRYAWGAAATGLQVRTFGDFTAASVGPGFDNRRAPGVTAERYIVRQRRDGAAFAEDLAAVPSDVDLLLIETWNEWWEGSTIAPAPYPSDRGGTLAEDYYLRLLRRWRFGEE